MALLCPGRPRPGWAAPGGKARWRRRCITVCRLLRPRRALFEQLREVDLEDAELVIPGVAKDPEVVPAFLLVVPTCGSKGFEAADLGLDVVGLQIEVHPLLVRLRVGGALEQEPDRPFGQTEFPIDGVAVRVERFLDGVERGAPEGGALVEVGDVDDEVRKSAAVSHEASALTRSWTTL